MSCPLADMLEDRARGGDSLAAVAFALLKLVDQERERNRALDRLGLNYQSPDGPPGVGEEIAMRLGEIAVGLRTRAQGSEE